MVSGVCRLHVGMSERGKAAKKAEKREEQKGRAVEAVRV